MQITDKQHKAFKHSVKGSVGYKLYFSSGAMRLEYFAVEIHA
jgi:hypothetical protein